MMNDNLLSELYRHLYLNQNPTATQLENFKKGFINANPKNASVEQIIDMIKSGQMNEESITNLKNSIEQGGTFTPPNFMKQQPASPNTWTRSQQRSHNRNLKKSNQMISSPSNEKIPITVTPNSTATNATKEGAKVAWGQNLKNKLNDFKANTTWTKGSGLQYKNHNIGKWSNIGQGVYQGVSALNNLGDLGDLREDTDTLENDIIRSAMSNPLVSSYLTSDQEALLNKLRNGTYSGDADGGDFFDGVFSGLGNIATGVLMGAPGGVPGMIIGGLGSAINSGIQGMQQGQTETNAQLQGLYSALNQAEQQYRAMRRPNVTGLGLRQSALEQMY